MAPKFVFSGTGTRGDLIPMLAIAAEMLRRGHDCHVLANEPSGDTARKLGVPFTSTAPAQLDNLTGIEGAFSRHVFPSFRANFAFIEAALARGAELVLVNSVFYAGSTLMAERYGLPLCRLTIAPFRIFSLLQPSYPLSEKVHGRLGKTYRRYVLPRLREQWYSHPYILTGLNAFRAELGLAPLESMCELERLVSYQVCTFPEWYCAPAPDWPQALQCVGFPLPPACGELPDDLARFIADRGAPIVFTPGTGVSDVAQFFETARQCCLQLGRPGVFLSSSLPMQNGVSDGPLYKLDYIDLALVLRRAALLVHHGGIGTTARALEAGIPQIISPQAFDQPDNGNHISKLGVGVMIPRAKLSAVALAGAARHLLENAAIQPVLQELSRRTRANDGIRGAADVLERQFLPSRLPAALSAA